MEILRSSAIPGQRGNPAYFTGDVWQELLVTGSSIAVKSLRVTFAPGARTHWHSHPGGQILYITAGRGWVQREGEDKQLVSVGDTVVFAPNERHWHGASADCVMQHIAAQPVVDGVDATWMEAVSPD
jgi:quercetin dioxygenase-like cupin family protein